jgi:hypothetical protein
MAEKVTTEKIEREEGYLYYLGKDGYVWRSPMRHNTTGKKSKVGTEHVDKEAGYMYFIDKEGYVARSTLNRAGRKPGS